jgi:hypothetical protein
LHNLDITTAFLDGDVDTEEYMGVPEGMDLDPNYNFVDPYTALSKPRIWWERMRTYMIPLIVRLSLL